MGSVLGRHLTLGHPTVGAGQPGQLDLGDLQVLPASQHHGVGLGIDADHEPGLPGCGDTETAALTDGEVDYPPVLSQHPAEGVYQLPGSEHLGSVDGKELPVVTAPNETYLHRLGLSGGAHPYPGGDATHLRLGVLPHGETGPGKLILGEHRQHVRLVLGPVSAPQQRPMAVHGVNTRVVARGQHITAELVEAA